MTSSLHYCFYSISFCTMDYALAPVHAHALASDHFMLRFSYMLPSVCLKDTTPEVRWRLTYRNTLDRGQENVWKLLVDGLSGLLHGPTW